MFRMVDLMSTSVKSWSLKLVFRTNSYSEGTAGRLTPLK